VLSKEQDKVMDAAISKVAQRHVQAILNDAAKRDRLYAKVKPILGVMDCADMTHADLAKYAAQK